MNSELLVANNPGFIQSVINYADTHTPKYETELKPVEGARIARYTDIGGKIPFIGAVVGLARLVSSVVIGIIAFLSMFLYPVNLCLLKPQRAKVLLRYCEHVAMNIRVLSLLSLRLIISLATRVAAIFGEGVHHQCTIEKKWQLQLTS